jgi:hypothetical protein
MPCPFGETGGNPPIQPPETVSRPAVKLSLRVRYRRARGCSRRDAVLTLSGTGLDRVLRAGLTFRSRRLAADRARPFRLTVTKKRLGGRRRGLVTVGSGCAAAGS